MVKYRSAIRMNVIHSRVLDQGPQEFCRALDLFTTFEVYDANMGTMVKSGKVRPLPPIIPCVVYHGKETWTVGLGFRDLFDHPGSLDHVVPDFEYLLYDLSEYSDEEIKGAVVLRVAFLLLKHIFSSDLPEKFPGIPGLLKDLLNKRNGLEYLETVLRYVSFGE